MVEKGGLIRGKATNRGELQNKENISSSNSEVVITSKCARKQTKSGRTDQAESAESEELNMAKVRSLPREEAQSTSSLSVSSEFPQPKKKILLSMEVITEEMQKDLSESMMSEQKRAKVKMFLETESQDGVLCPVPSKAELGRNTEQADGPGWEEQCKQKAKDARLVANKPRKSGQEVGKGVCEENGKTRFKSFCEKEFQSKKLSKEQVPKKAKEAEHVLSFSSGTNLTQTTFDFGFSKLGSCECSEQVRTSKSGKEKATRMAMKVKTSKSGSTNIKKKSQKKTTKTKNKTKKTKGTFSKNQKCCQCGKSTQETARNSILEVPNFVVQPFNKYETVLKPRKYELDQRGTLGNSRSCLINSFGLGRDADPLRRKQRRGPVPAEAVRAEISQKNE